MNAFPGNAAEPPEAMLLRPAHRDDAPALALLHGAAFADAWGADIWRGFLSEPTTRAWCALPGAGAKLGGFLLARFVVDEGEILSFAVAAACRRRGIGQGLLARCLREAETLALTQVVLEVAADNDAAIALYESLGFFRYGVRRAYYPSSYGAPTDALLLRHPCATGLNEWVT